MLFFATGYRNSILQIAAGLRALALALCVHRYPSQNVHLCRQSVIQYTISCPEAFWRYKLDLQPLRPLLYAVQRHSNLHIY